MVIELFSGHGTHSKWVAVAMNSQLRQSGAPCLVTTLTVDCQATPALDGGAMSVPSIICDIRDWGKAHTVQLMAKFPKCKVSVCDCAGGCMHPPIGRCL